MKSWWKTVLVVGFFITATVVFFVTKNKTPFDQRKPAVSDPAPEIALSDLAGNMLSLKDYKGKVVLVNFWASWCPPCKEELPVFQKALMRFEEKGFAVIAIALDDVQPALIRELGLLFPVAKTSERVSKAYGNISDVPVSFLIDRNGRIIRKVWKVYPEEDLLRDVAAALSEKEGA